MGPAACPAHSSVRRRWLCNSTEGLVWGQRIAMCAYHTKNGIVNVLNRTKYYFLRLSLNLVWSELIRAFSPSFPSPPTLLALNFWTNNPFVASLPPSFHFSISDGFSTRRVSVGSISWPKALARAVLPRHTRLVVTVCSLEKMRRKFVYCSFSPISSRLLSSCHVIFRSFLFLWFGWITRQV